MLLALPLFGSAPAQAQARRVALTFDDGPDLSDEVGMTASMRNAAILGALSGAKVHSILFVTRTDQDERRIALLRQWGLEGHLIGNHTATHPDFGSKRTSLHSFEGELLACEQALGAMPGYTKLFRFPFLKEGDTREKRDGFREFLRSHGYREGRVSIDTSDWYYNQRLRERLVRDPHADRTAYRDAYLAHLVDRARYYDALSQQVLHRSVSHVMLLHHNLINALFLPDVIRRLQQEGWQLIDAASAFEDPVYQMQPDTLPAGESILWALAEQQGIAGLRWPGEDDRYEKPLLDALQL
jgi:peptidoglycan/xylan/chitin deacetylase (PgdA/CDA1 family)